MFPTPPSLEQHPAFSPITPHRDTPSLEPPAPSGVADHLPSLAAFQLAECRMEMEESVASPGQDDIKVSSLNIQISCEIRVELTGIYFSLFHSRR